MKELLHVPKESLDVNAFGEKMRKWCFVGKGVGGYSNFDLRDGFKRIDPSTDLGKKLMKLLEYDEELYDIEGYQPSVYLFHHPEFSVYLAWYWDGDGTLLIGCKDKWVINHDCKKDYTWEWVEQNDLITGKEEKNLVKEKEVVVLNDFLYLEFHDAKVWADTCEIHKSYGLFLYKNGELVYHLQSPIAEVIFVEIDEPKSYYVIKTDRFLKETLYLVTKAPNPSPLNVGEKVVLKGDESVGLTYAYMEDETIFDRLYKDIEKKYLWTVLEIKDNLMVTLQKGKESKKVSINDVITIDKIKENANYLRNK